MADYSETIEETGNNVMITLHQSYLNNSYDTDINTDTNEKFYISSPGADGFNATDISINVSSIQAPDKNLEIETGTTQQNVLYADDYAVSFQVPGDCILHNFSICFSETLPAAEYNASIQVEILNAIWYASDSEWGPGSNILHVISSDYTIENDTFSTWYNFTNLDKSLSISSTQNNMFFIWMHQTTSTSRAQVEFHSMPDDTSDDSKVWRDYDPGGWAHLSGRDPSLKLYFLPPNSDNTPKPEDINLQINNTDVNNIDSQNEGTWDMPKEIEITSNQLEFEVTADWWDVSCKIDTIQANYTNENVYGIANFTITANDAIVYWNVTMSEVIDQFEVKFENPYINFTIPTHWQYVKVWRGGTEQTISTTRSLGTGYNESQVLNPENGNFWFLNATTSNLISKNQGILTYVGGSDVDIINYTDTIDINANFSINIANNDGDFNLSVYNHDLPRYLNHTKDLTTFTGGTEINVNNWIVADNVTEYGKFRVQILWNNGTDAGYREKAITILGETKMVISSLSKTTFNADESFNITVLYNDTKPMKELTNPDINYTLNGIKWRSDNNITYIGGGKYNITIFCNDSQFGGYGPKTIFINANKTYYNNHSKSVDILILGKTGLDFIGYPGVPNFNSGDIFNITIEFNDTLKKQGIEADFIEYRLNDTASFRSDNKIQYIGNGRYNITIYCNDTDFTNYGSYTITINANKTDYNNQSDSRSLTITGETSIWSVRYPDKIFYYSNETFNITVTFNDSTRTNPEIDSPDIEYRLNTTEPYITTNVVPIENGQYNITINCSDDFFKDNNYGSYRIGIKANKTYYQNRTAFLDILIIGQTSLDIFEPLGTPIYLKDQTFNITIQFTDTEFPKGIGGATIEYKLDEGAPFLDTNWTHIGGGRYNITIDVNHENFTSYGLKTIIINASKQYYNNRTVNFTFYRRITTQISPDVSPDLGDVIKFNNISYTFNYSDTDNNLIKQASWDIIDGYDFLAYLEKFGNGTYTMHLNTSQVDLSGSPYDFIFNISAPGNETQIITLTINVILRQTTISNVTYINNVPVSALNLTVRFYFNDTLTKSPLIGLKISNISLENVGIVIVFVWDIYDLGSGFYLLNISLSGLSQDTYTINLTVFWTIDYNSSYTLITFTYGSLPGLPSDGGGGGGGGGGTKVTGIPFETLVLYIIIIAAVIGTVAAIVGVQKGVIAPKKREKERILREVTTIFDDAINLEHILVIYKESGTCVFFKSYGIEEIDPELISGFLSAVSSFGREMDSQEALNEIQYGDKMLLLADGEFIRVALVLNKQASIILRQHLKEFIDIYEEKYASSLPNWRGQLADFRDSGELIDRVFSTSIILPHQVNYDAKKVKLLQSPHSKDVLKVANTLVTDSDKKYFFIATLLVEATDKTGKEKAEVFMGIKELRDNNILTPIEISAIEKPPITQQELDLIRQQVCDLPNLDESEIDELVRNLAQMGPAEREAYFASCREQAVVVSAPIKTKAETGLIDSEKIAKKEIKNLKKLANTALKRKDTQRAIEIFKNAAVIATNWDLTKEFEELEDVIRITTINDLKAKMKVFESEAKVAAKGGDYSEATQRYSLAARAASEIFKLGITEMTKEVKRLTNKSKEYERLS